MLEFQCRLMYVIGAILIPMHMDHCILLHGYTSINVRQPAASRGDRWVESRGERVPGRSREQENLVNERDRARDPPGPDWAGLDWMEKSGHNSVKNTLNKKLITFLVWYIPYTLPVHTGVESLNRWVSLIKD